MAINNLYSMVNNDGEVPIEDLLMQIEQLQSSQQSQNQTESVVDNLTKQILAQGNTANWKGGVDAETAAKDMAKIMAGIGITDISQFGKVTQTGLNEDVRPDGRGGFVNLKGQPVDPALVVPFEMDGNVVGYFAPTGTQETYGNKETGQVVPNTYAERQTGNAFGGTYQGKGNTAYRVDIGADGKPVFYTTGASSRDDISAFAPIIAAALTPILGPAAASLLGPTASTLATGALTGAMVGGGTAAITGDSILKGALLGGAGGALGDYLKGADGAVLGDASDIAMQMADAGKTLPEIEAALTNSGFSPTVVAESLKDAANVLAPTATSIPSSVPSLLDTVSVVGSSTTPALNSLLGAAATIPSITATQGASTVTTPTTTPVAEQTITSDKPTSVQDVINAVTSVTPTTTPTQVTTPTTTEQVVTADRPATVADIINSITSVSPVTTTTTPVTTPSVIPEQVITGQSPTTNVADVINTIAATIPTTTTTVTPTSTVVPEQVITEKAPTTITQDVINAITSILPTTTPVATTPVTTPVVPEQVVTADKPKTISDVINTIVSAVTPTTTPTTPTTTTETTKEKDKSLGVSDVIRLAQIGTTIAALNAASNAGGGTNQYDIVPVPESWTTPTTTGGTTTTLPPINFGNRNLLIGTQWEKLLDPNYGKIPEPRQYGQPSNLSYNDLMGILGNRQGMPSANSLTINDIISGIQNQYGQVPSRTMG